MRRIASVLLPAISVVLASLTLVGVQPAFADSSVALALDGFHALAVDPAHGTDAGHLIVSGWNPAYGGTRTGVVVTGLDGSNPVTAGTLTHAEGLAMAPDDSVVYVALDDGDAIAAFAPTDPQTITTYSTGSTTCPHSLAVAGDGKVWFSYGCNTSTEDLGVLDPSDKSVTLGLAFTLFGRQLSGDALLANSPAAPDSIVLGERAAPGILAVLSVNGKTASVTVQGSVNFAVDIEVSPDGSSFLLLQSNSGATVHRLSMATLLDEGSYAAVGGAYGNSYTSTASESSDGSYVAAGGYLDNSVTTFGPDSSEPIRTYLFGSGANVEAGPALAWIGHTLVVVTTDAFTRVPTLHFLSGPIQAPSSISLAGPSTATRAAPLTLTGTVLSRGSGVGPSSVTVSKHDLDGDHPLGSVPTDQFGDFVIHDTPRVGGKVTYHVTFGGDETHQSANKSFTVSVSRSTVTLTVTPSKSIYNYGATESVAVHLGTTFSNRAVSIYAQQVGGVLKLLRSGDVNSSGNLSASVAFNHNFAFIAKFAGDEHFAPKTVTVHCKVRVKINSAIAGSYGTSGGYHLFHQSSGGGFAIRVFPSKAGEQATLLLQKKINGVWRTVTHGAYTDYLDSNSILAAGFDGQIGPQYRVGGVFHADASNAGGSSKWWYVKFT